MEKCPICKEYVFNGLENHKCKPKWFCFDASSFKKDETPTPEEFYSFGTAIFASSPSEAAIEYMKWYEQRNSDYFDEMEVLVLEKENRIFKYVVSAETTRDYSVYDKPEITELKVDDTKDNPKLFEF
jgi:hypothetical protein